MATTVAAWTAERVSDGPQWPDIPAGNPQWPNVRLDDLDAVRVNPRPAFIDPVQVEDRILGRPSRAPARWSAASKSNAVPIQPSAADGLDANASGGTARWPSLPPEKQPSQFAFEAGARYWYSSGSMNFAFSNGHPLFGSPTSTLDWLRLSSHSGEGFARLDHIPSGFFVKGVAGLGNIFDGSIIDRDFFIGQLKFSDTTSDVTNGRLSYGIFDVGWAFHPVPDIRIGFFAGYHYWNEKVTAKGLVCNMASPLGCASAGEVLIGYDVAVLAYEPTWHAARVGVEGKFMIAQGWSVSGEIAAIPYAALQNKDSHLLRDDLGPAPNVITKSTYAFGVEAELFLNYAVTPNIELSAGVRYWGLTARLGDVGFGPAFDTSNKLNDFDHQRYGVLLQIKGKL